MTEAPAAQVPTSAPGGDGVTISEMATSLGTTVRALRYYEDARILWPDRSRGNARLYGAAARDRARLVVALRRADVPLKCIKAVMLSEGGQGRQFADLLKARLAEAEAQVRQIRKLLVAAEAGSLVDAGSMPGGRG